MRMAEMRVSAMVVFTRNLKQGGENARAGNRLSLNARVVRTRRGHLFGGGGGREQCREENQEQQSGGNRWSECTDTMGGAIRG